MPTATATRKVKNHRFILAKQQLRKSITLFSTFLCRHCTTTVWKRLISYSFMEDVNKRGRIFFFLYLNLSAVPKKFIYILTFSLNWNKPTPKKTLKFILKVTFSLPSPSSMRKLPWYLKESLRTYKLLPLQNEYGDPAILFQTTTNRQSLTKISLQVLLKKNDLKNWLNGNFGLNLQLLKLRSRLGRVISSLRLLTLFPWGLFESR